MNDLVRKEDVITALRKAGLIEKNIRGDYAIQVIESVPVAYDPDAVVEEIKNIPFPTAGLHSRVIGKIREGLKQ